MKTIVITGSTRVIGFGLAKEFLNSGNNVVINGRSDISVNEALSKLEGKKIIGVSGNISSEKTISKLYS